MNRKKLVRDIALILIILALSTAILIVTRSRKEQGAYVIVMVENTEIARYSMTVNGIYDINANNGKTNRIEIRDGRVRMIEASCPNHLCIRQGWISLEGQSIVCLPNRVTVTVHGTGGGFDFVQ